MVGGATVGYCYQATCRIRDRNGRHTAEVVGRGPTMQVAVWVQRAGELHKRETDFCDRVDLTDAGMAARDQASIWWHSDWGEANAYPEKNIRPCFRMQLPLP